MPGETPIILMDNARWHTGGRTMRFIREEMSWDLLNHPAWSPDFDPLDRELNGLTKEEDLKISVNWML